jgi:hypothetical protein
MRILLTDHWPTGVTAPADLPPLVSALRAAGHDVRWLVVTDAEHLPTIPGVHAVVCQSPDNLSAFHRLPVFETESDSPYETFASLSHDQWTEYRSKLRLVLNDVVEKFDPEIIHAHGIWIWAHLALESGVPYVVSPLGPELDRQTCDVRGEALVDQAAENAGCIITASEDFAAQCRQRWPELDSRIKLLPAGAGEGDPSLAKRLTEIYESVLQERFG